jgi:hypothetical protein
MTAKGRSGSDEVKITFPLIGRAGGCELCSLENPFSALGYMQSFGHGAAALAVNGPGQELQ